MVGSEDSMDIDKSVKISIEAVIVHELIPFFGSPRETKHNMDL